MQVHELSLVSSTLRALSKIYLTPDQLSHLSPAEREELAEYIPLDLAPELAARSIDSESYWRRRLNDPHVKGGFKQKCLERILAHRIESLDLTPIRPLAEACGPWIFSLTISSVPPHLTDLSFLFETCPSLSSLTLTFGAKTAGVSYDRGRLGMRLRDAQNIFSGQNSECLTYLALPNNLIDDELVKILSPGLLTLSRTLTHLDLSRNCIGDRGTRRIASLLSHLTTLTHLNLSDNDIHAHGAMRLGQDLPKTLLSLDLCLNRIEDTGACQLLQDLSLNTTLCNLSLACNTLTIRSLPFLASFLVENNTLRQLDLSGNPDLLTTESLAINPAVAIGNSDDHSLLEGFEEFRVFADSPVGVFVQCLRRNVSLKTMDLTGTQFPSVNMLQRN